MNLERISVVELQTFLIKILQERAKDRKSTSLIERIPNLYLYQALQQYAKSIAPDKFYLERNENTI